MAIFDRFVGEYAFAPTIFLTITRHLERFYGQLSGQPPFEIFAEGENRFFVKAVDAQLSFETNAEQKVIAVTLHQGGRDQRATKIQ